MKTKLDLKIVRYLLFIFFLLILFRYFDFFLNTVQDLFVVTKPLLIGILMAYIVNVIVSRLESSVLRKLKEKSFKLARAISILASILLIVALLYMIIKLIVPQLLTLVTSLVNGIPTLVQQLQELMKNNEFDQTISFLGDNIQADFDELSRRLLSFITTSANNLLSSLLDVVGGATSGLFSFVISFSLAIYVLVSKEKLIAQASTIGIAFLPEKWYKQLGGFFTIAHHTFSSFFIGQGLEAVILGSLCIVGMTIFGFPYALTIGTFIGFTALIPMFGAWIGAGVGFVLIASQSFSQALLFIVFIIILQQLENNLIYPRVMGTSIGIPGLWVLIAITIGGGLYGIVGMLLGVPTVATLYQIVKILTYQKIENEPLGLNDIE